MHRPHIPQCTIQNRNVFISGLNGALRDMRLMRCGISETALLIAIYISITMFRIRATRPVHSPNFAIVQGSFRWCTSIIFVCIYIYIYIFIQVLRYQIFITASLRGCLHINLRCQSSGTLKNDPPILFSITTSVYWTKLMYLGWK